MIKMLAINVDGNGPAHTEVHEACRSTVKGMILDLLNKHGKNSHVLIKWNDVLYTCSHTSKRGPSKEYYRTVLMYHPLEDLLTS